MQGVEGMVLLATGLKANAATSDEAAWPETSLLPAAYTMPGRRV